MEEDYKQLCEALLARLAHAEQSYKESLERTAMLTAKADALERECERKDRYIAELTAEVERIKHKLDLLLDPYSERERNRGIDRCITLISQINDF